MVVALSSTGCSEDTRASGLDAAVTDYEAGRYDDALGKANSAYSRLSGAPKYEAAYIAGMSAYELDRFREAEGRFAISGEAADRNVAGRSKAMMGLIRLRENRPRDAARYYTDAAKLLEGDDSAQASYQAGLAYQAAGDPSSARAQFIIASGRSRDAEVRKAAASRLDQAGFTVQVGAFSRAANAERAAEDVRPKANRNHLGSVHVVERRDSRGRTWHLVQVGAFGTRQAAERARSLLAAEARVVPIAASGV
jgi:tetratricopeptide (TPR) repeat protein